MPNDFDAAAGGGNGADTLGSGREKHSDNHALWIDPDDGEHLLAGTDAGLYETFDEGTTWRHFPNLPVSQFYKVAVDNAEPFYNILGGAQDLGTILGPSRTMNTDGIRNQDWTVPLGADGYGVAFDPDDPDTMYMETQVGNLQRIDRHSYEVVDIQPQPAPGEAPPAPFRPLAHGGGDGGHGRRVRLDLPATARDRGCLSGAVHIRLSDAKGWCGAA